MANQPASDDQELSFGSPEPPRPFDEEPTIIIFDLNRYLFDPRIDLKPFSGIVTIIYNANTLRHELINLNRSFTVVSILPQYNNPQVQTFVQQNLLISPHVNNFCLMFIDGQANNMGALYSNQLIGCYSITSRIPKQTRTICARVNDRNIDFCDEHRRRNEAQENIGVANLYAVQKYDRINLQLAYNEQIRREIEEQLLG